MPVPSDEVWRAMTPQERRRYGAQWYRDRPLLRPTRRPWTDASIRAHLAEVRRAVALLVADQVADADAVARTDWLSTEMDATREELAALRSRAELGERLAAAVAEAGRISELMAAQTGPIPKQRAEVGVS